MLLGVDDVSVAHTLVPCAFSRLVDLRIWCSIQSLFYHYLLFINHTQNRGPEAKLYCGLQYKNIKYVQMGKNNIILQITSRIDLKLNMKFEKKEICSSLDDHNLQYYLHVIKLPDC